MGSRKSRNRARLVSVAAICAASIASQAQAVNFISTTWLPPGGGTQPYWLNPALWSGGVVPNDDATNKYLANIGASQTVNLQNSLPDFSASSSTVYDLNLGSGAVLNVAIPMTVEDNVNGPLASVVVQGTTFSNLNQQTAAGCLDFISVQSGGTATLGYTSVNLSANDYSVYSADGAGSLLDLHTAQNLVYDPSSNGGYHDTISATGGGTVDLSGITTIARVGNGPTLTLQSSGGGIIKLNSLQTINASPSVSTQGPQVFFSPGTSALSLPALTLARATQFTLPAGASVSAPVLQNLTDGSVLSLAGGASFNAPNLINITDASISIAGGSTFTTGSISQMNGAAVAVTGGAVFHTVATSYAFNQDNYITLSADGAGSSLDLHTFQSVIFNPPSNNGYSDTISATNNGAIDLSNVTTIERGGNGPSLHLQTSGGGTINLNALQTIDSNVAVFTAGPQVFFNPAASFTLPALTLARATQFTAASGASTSLPQLQTFTDGSVVSLASGGTFNAPNLTNITNASISIAGGSTFTTGSISQMDGASVAVTGGAAFHTVATSYSFNQDAYITLSADGTGSQLDLHTLHSLIYNPPSNNGYIETISATNNAAVDLSGVLTIERGGNGPSLHLQTSSGGTINLNALQTINANPAINTAGPQVVFNPGPGAISLPALTGARATQFTLAAGTSISLPQLQTFIDGSALSLASGASFSAPLLTNITNSNLTIAGGSTFTAGSISQMNGAGITVTGGAAFHTVATSYSFNQDAYITLSADGAGSLLDLHTITNLLFNPPSNNGYIDTVSATSGGTVDLSSLATIERGGNGPTLQLQSSAGGLIKLNSLQTINANPLVNSGGPQVVFNPGPASISLPALTLARATQFTLIGGASASLPQLQTLSDGSVLNLASGASFSAPQLTNISNSTLAIAGGATFTTGGLSQINGANLAVTGGAIFHTTATSDSLNRDAYLTLSADGTGSLLDLHTVQALAYNPPSNNGYQDNVSASNNGTVDLSGVTAISGGGNGPTLIFTASNGGSIKLNSLQSINSDNMNNGVQTTFNVTSNGSITLGNISAARSTAININDASATFIVQGNLNLGNNSALTIAPGATLQITGNFSHNFTTASQLSAGGGIVKMNGATSQFLEVASADAGTSPGNNPAFSLGQLQIGSNAIATEVDLADNINNGNQGAGPTPEALYLNGANGQGGLVMLGGSILVLNNLNAYEFQNGSWLSLQSLFTGGQNLVPFTLNGSDGYIEQSSTLLQAIWTNPNNDLWDTPGNWNIGKPALFNDVYITQTNGVTVTGPATSTQVRSITIDAAPIGGTSLLNLSSNVNLKVNTNIQIGTHGRINQTAGTLSSVSMNVLGEFDQGGAGSFQTGPITNSGTISAGGAMIASSLMNNGPYTQSGGTATLGPISGSGTLAASGNAVVTVSSINQASLTLSGTAKLTLAPSLSNTLNSLSLTGGAILDLTKASLTINYGNSPDPLSAIQSAFHAGYANGAWNGPGLESSQTDAHHGPGYIDANSSIQIRYTLDGDTNLDGSVNFTDLLALAQNYNSTHATWATGDFNYDSTTNFADLLALAQNYNATLSGPQADELSPSFISQWNLAQSEASAVPEPASLAMVSVAGMGLLARRRRTL